MASLQKSLGRVRPPRVQITYDVDIGDAIQKEELPFIVGILSDLSGIQYKDFPPLKKRDFIEIDRDNFDAVLAASKPSVKYKVENKIPAEEGEDTPDQVSIEVTFESIDQFEPFKLVESEKIPSLFKLYKKRCRIRDFQSKLDGNDTLYLLADKMVCSFTANDEAKIKADALEKGLEEEEINALIEKEKKTSEEGKTLREELVGLFPENDPEKWKSVAVSDGSILDTMFNKKEGQAAMVLDPEQQEYALQITGQVARSIFSGIDAENKKSINQLFSDVLGGIDGVITKQLNLILHHPDYQAIEATWRGMHYLVSKTETGKRLKLKVLNVSKKDLIKDLEKAVEFDQSQLFKKIYEDEYGTYGGNPYSMLLGDYEFGRHIQDTSLLGKLSGLAACAHAPFIAAAYAKLFDMEDYSNLAIPRDLGKIFESAELIKWQSFRDSEDSRYVTLTLPRVLLRLPYGPETIPVEGFDFTEDADGKEAKKYLWGNPAFVLAERITHAFALYGWTAAIRGVEGGGLVEDLPVHLVPTGNGDKAITCPTQVAITDRREKELNDLGFMAICHCKNSDKAAFFGGQTTNKPKVYNTNSANANSSISAMLPYMLNASRFAHYIKVMMRKKVGSFQTRANIEAYLNTWITQYVLLDESAGQESKAAFPLQQGRVVVTEIAGKPGSYNATVFLRPHFQLEELSTSIRLVAEIPG